jgi:hypothetical protein
MRTPRNSLKIPTGETLKELSVKHRIDYGIVRYRYRLGIEMPELVKPVDTRDRDSKFAAELQGLTVYTCLPCKICGCTTKNVENYACRNRHTHAAIRKEMKV